MTIDADVLVLFYKKALSCLPIGDEQTKTADVQQLFGGYTGAQPAALHQPDTRGQAFPLQQAEGAIALHAVLHHYMSYGRTQGLLRVSSILEDLSLEDLTPGVPDAGREDERCDPCE